MSIGLALLHCGLGAAAFSTVLNGFLRGRAKASIDAFLSLCWLGLLATAFVLWGWQQGLVAIASSFAYAIAASPLAKALTRKMLGYRTSMAVDDGETDYTVEGLLRQSDDTDVRLTRIARMPTIAHVLATNDLGADDLKEQYGFLLHCGLDDLSWEIVSTPADLQMLLDMRRRGFTTIEIASRLMRTV